ncbi:LysR family transcriptional regulator [Kocuria polaris]|nr:LysR family transcriptional regulator [Kocuria polaris]
MELQQLRYVLAVAETRNFTRAAQRCFVVQSALSRQIKALEGELGLQLFARSSRRVELTQAGAAFLPAARAALEAADRAVADASAAAGRLRGTLTIGVIPTVTALNVPAALGAFREAHPDVRISLRVGGSDEFMADVAAGSLDVALLGLSESLPPRRVASAVLARERLVAVVPSDHRLAARRRLGLGDLADEPFVDFPAGAPGRIPSDAAFAAAGVRREVAYEAAGLDMMLGLVQQGLAVALLAAGAVAGRAGLATIPLSDGPVRVQHLAWSDFNPSPAALAFVELARAQAEPSFPS